MKKERNIKRSKPSFVKVLSTPYFLVLILLIIIPIFIMVLYSFQSDNISGVFKISFTLNHYISFFKEKNFIKVMSKSIYLALISTFITLIIGYPIAYLISTKKPRTQAILMTLVTSPLWINMLLRTLALKQVIDLFFKGLIGTNLAVIIGMVYMFLPFMIIPIYTVLQKIDPALIEAAEDLGASKSQIIGKVIIPLSFSGIISGIMMVLLPAATTLVVPKYLGNGMYLIGNLIEDIILKQGRFGYGSAIAIILSLIMMGLVFLLRKSNNYRGGARNDQKV